MSTESNIKLVRAASWVLFAANVVIMLGVKEQHSKGATIFFMISIGIGVLAFITYCCARFRKQSDVTRNVIEAITPLAMLGAIVIGIIVICVLIPMLINHFS